MSLQDRCRQWLETAGGEWIEDDLRDFVLSEIGRAASEQLSEASPLVLYFADETARAELVKALVTDNPNLIERKWPR